MFSAKGGFMGDKRLLIVGIIILIIVGFYMFRGAAPSNEQMSGEPKSMEMSASVVSLAATGNSGQTGTVTFSDVDGKTDVTANLSGVPAGAVEPIHIHLGSCAELGGVKYPLSNVVDGVSKTMLEVSLDQILSEFPLAINAHKSADEIGVYVACGDITASAMMEKEGETMMKEEEQ